jgi:hypothetical protein
MMAICPAGPPKLMKPSLSQNENACQKLTGAGVLLLPSVEFIFVWSAAFCVQSIGSRLSGPAL